MEQTRTLPPVDSTALRAGSPQPSKSVTTSGTKRSGSSLLHQLLCPENAVVESNSLYSSWPIWCERNRAFRRDAYASARRDSRSTSDPPAMSELAKVGVLGVGTIAEALTTGLCAFGDQRAEILLSPQKRSHLVPACTPILQRQGRQRQSGRRGWHRHRHPLVKATGD
jgi:hypothetical protein